MREQQGHDHTERLHEQLCQFWSLEMMKVRLELSSTFLDAAAFSSAWLNVISLKRKQQFTSTSAVLVLANCSLLAVSGLLLAQLLSVF